jgi:hypothetical protein
MGKVDCPPRHLGCGLRGLPSGLGGPLGGLEAQPIGGVLARGTAKPGVAAAIVERLPATDAEMPPRAPMPGPQFALTASVRAKGAIAQGNSLAAAYANNLFGRFQRHATLRLLRIYGTALKEAFWLFAAKRQTRALDLA